jgi:hypothetical protein
MAGRAAKAAKAGRGNRDLSFFHENGPFSCLFAPQPKMQARAYGTLRNVSGTLCYASDNCVKRLRKVAPSLHFFCAAARKSTCRCRENIFCHPPPLPFIPVWKRREKVAMERTFFHPSRSPCLSSFIFGPPLLPFTVLARI